MSSSDFRADRIRGHRFILSGSSSANPAFMIYSASVASDLNGGIKNPGQGGFNPTPAGGIGDDVFLVVSGTSGSMGRGASNRVRGTMLFLGDVFFSGVMAGNVVSGADGPIGPRGLQGLTGSSAPSLNLSSNALIFSISPSGSTTASPTSITLTADYVSQSNAMVLADFKASGSDGSDLSGRLSAFSNTSTSEGGRITGASSIIFSYNNADREKYPIFVTASSDSFSKSLAIYRVAGGVQGPTGTQGIQGIQGLTGSAPPSISFSSTGLIFNISPSGSATSVPSNVTLKTTYVSQSNAMVLADYRVSGSDGSDLSGRLSSFSNSSTTSGGTVTGNSTVLFSYNNSDIEKFPVFVTASSDGFSETLTLYRVSEGAVGPSGSQPASLAINSNSLIFSIEPSGSTTSSPTSVRITAEYISASQAFAATNFAVSGSDGTDLFSSRFSGFSNTSTTENGKVTGEASVIFSYNDADKARYPVFVTASIDSFSRSLTVYRISQGQTGETGVQGPSGGDGIFSVVANTGIRGRTTSSAAFNNPVGDADLNSVGFGKGTDVFFYVSGSRNSSYSMLNPQAATGTALFGGDVVTSGALQVKGVPGGMIGGIGISAAGAIFSQTSITSSAGFMAMGGSSTIMTLTASVSRAPTGQPYIAGGGGTSATYSHTSRAWTISSTVPTLDIAYDGGGTGAGAIIDADAHPVQIGANFADGFQQPLLAVSGVAVFGSASKETSSHMPPLPGVDTSFFVSGSVSAEPLSGRSPIGTAVFGGDTVFSGSIGGTLRASATGSNVEVLRTYTPLHFRAKSNAAETTTALILDRSGSVSNIKGGTRILFKIPFDNGSVPGAAIEGAKDSASSTQNYGRLSFYTQNTTGQLDEQLKIGYDGVTIKPGLGGNLDAGSRGATLLVHGGVGNLAKTEALMVKKSNAFVGVGVQPTVALHVSGAAFQLDGPQPGQDGNPATLAKIYNISSEDDGALDIYENRSGGPSANIRLTTRAGMANYLSSSAGLMLGINTTSPQGPGIDIVQGQGTGPEVDPGNPQRYGLIVRNEDFSTGESAGIAFGNSANNVGAGIIYVDSGSQAVGDLYFLTKASIGASADPVERMRITKDGNIGIGTSAPKVPLDIHEMGGLTVGYTRLNNGGAATNASYQITTSYAVPTSDWKASFVAPSSGNVEIQFMCYLATGASSAARVFLGLSTSSSYSALSSAHEHEAWEVDEEDNCCVSHSWVLTGLTPGTSYTYYIGTKHTFGSDVLFWRYGGTNQNLYQDLIIRTIAIPKTLTTD